MNEPWPKYILSVVEKGQSISSERIDLVNLPTKDGYLRLKVISFLVADFDFYYPTNFLINHGCIIGENIHDNIDYFRLLFSEGIHFRSDEFELDKLFWRFLNNLLEKDSSEQPHNFLELLLDWGADVSVRCNLSHAALTFRTIMFPIPLHLAVYINDLKLVILFLKYDANINAADNQGKTALHWLAWLQSSSKTPPDQAILWKPMTQLLLEQPSIRLDILDLFGHTAVDDAINFYNLDWMEYPPVQNEIERVRRQKEATKSVCGMCRIT